MNADAQSLDEPASMAKSMAKSMDWIDFLCMALCIAFVIEIPELALIPLAAWVIGGTLEHLFPYRVQKVFSPGWHNAVFYSVLSSGAAAGLIAPLLVLVGDPLRHALAPVAGQLLRQPLIVQLIESLLIADLADYFFHRACHSVPLLWRFHSIHHSMENLNWLQAYRAHPLDKAVTSAVAILPIYALGLTGWPVAALVFFLIDAINTPFAHGNIRVNVGRFWWVVRTPQYHRWHHARSKLAMNRNFSQVFPIWDVIFRTAYMPKDRQPEAFGLPGGVPPRFIDQVLLPFRPAEERYLND